jgi:hypothetical protein
MHNDVEDLGSPALQGLVRAEGGSESDELPRETVIVVHGTWAGLRSGASRFLSDTIETMIRQGQRSRLALSNRGYRGRRRALPREGVPYTERTLKIGSMKCQ